MADLADVKILIRSLLLSCQQGATLDILEADYRSEAHAEIPFRVFNFSSLLEFLACMPDVVRFGKNKFGQPVLFAVADSSTQHIARLVKRQRSQSKPARALHMKAATARKSTAVDTSFSKAPARVSPRTGAAFVAQNGASGSKSLAGTSRSLGKPPTANERALNLPVTHNNSLASSSRDKEEGRIAKTPPKLTPTSQRRATNASGDVGTAKLELIELCKELNIADQPVFRTVKLADGILFVSSVVVGDVRCTGGGQYASEHLAEAAAATAAVAKLKMMAETQRRRGDCVAHDAPSGAEVADRIAGIVSAFQNGCIKSYLEQLYLEKYNEVLPPNWLELVRKHKSDVLNITEGAMVVIAPWRNPEHYEQWDLAMKRKVTSPSSVPSRGVQFAPVVDQYSYEKDTFESSGSIGSVVVEPKPAKRSTDAVQLYLTDLPPFEFPSEPFWKIWVTSVTSPGQFCFTVEEPGYGDKLDALKSDMTKFYGSGNGRSVTAAVEDGLYAVFCDGEWQRCYVNVIEDSTKPTVYFCDCGAFQQVLLDNFRVLEEEFASLPKQSVCAALPGCSNRADYPEDVNRRFIDLVLGKYLIAKSTSCEEAEALEVDLYDATTGSSEDVWIAAKILQHGSPAAPSAVPVDQANQPNVQAGMLGKKNPSSYLNVTVADFIGVEPLNSANEVSRLRGNNDNLSKNEIPLFGDIPEPGGSFDVVVSLANSPDSFIVQPYGFTEDLQHLSQQMTAYYANYVSLPSADVQLGKCYAAPVHTTADQTTAAWFRAYVTAIEDNGVARVFNVDYGEFDVVSLTKLRPLLPQFCSLSMQAIKASLGRVKPKHGADWSEEAAAFFSRLVNTRPFYSIVLGREDKHYEELGGLLCTKLVLELVDTVSDGNVDVYVHEEMIKHGFAAYRD